MTVEDRASVVARAVLQMISERLTAELHTSLTNYLRDEFGSAARQAISDIRPEDE